jgi:hypothetical protein
VIYVKEHPSTFTRVCSRFGRFPDYYNSIAALDGVKLLDIDIGTHACVHNATAVATIAGTVAVEALAANIPTIYFGNGPVSYTKSSLLHRFTQDEAAAEFLRRCSSPAYAPAANSASCDIVKAVDGVTYSGLDEEARWVDDPRLTRKFRRRALIKAWSSIVFAEEPSLV